MNRLVTESIVFYVANLPAVGTFEIYFALSVTKCIFIAVQKSPLKQFGRVWTSNQAEDKRHF